MAENQTESPKKKKNKSPKKKSFDTTNLYESLHIKPEEKSADLKRRAQSSEDDEGASKKPKIEAPKANGQASSSPSTNSKWSFEDEEALLDKVEEYLVSREDVEGTKKPIYIKDIEWSKIDGGELHSSHEAQLRFTTISNRVRKLRTAREILIDMKQVHKKVVPSAKKKEVDPDLPKKPHPPYIRFVMAKRQGIVERHPGMKNLEVTRKLASKWKKLSEEKRKKYLDRYHEDMEDYNHQIIEYLKNHNPGVSPPKTKFELWSEDEKKKIKAERPDISEKKLNKKLKRRWENLEEGEQTKWEEQEKKELKNFRDRISRLKRKNKPEQKIESSSEDKSEAQVLRCSK